MAKTDRVLRAARGAPGPRRRRPGPELARDARRRRPHASAATSSPCATSASRSRASAAAAAATGCRPGYRVPPLMFTAGEAAAVALGLMAARRLGLEADDALAKVRRVAARPRAAAASSRSSTRSASPASSRPRSPDGETLLAIAEATRRGRRVLARYTDSAGVDTFARAQPLRPRRPRRPLVRPGLRPRPRGAAHAARRPLRHRPPRPAPPSPPRRASTRSPSSPARSPASPGRTRSRSSCTPTSPPPPAASHPPSPSSSPHGDRTLLRLRADSLDWAAGLLAAAGCDFTVRHPHTLRTALRDSPAA